MARKEAGDKKRRKRVWKPTYSKLWRVTVNFTSALEKLFRSFLNEHRETDENVRSDIYNLKEKIKALFISWVASKRLEEKFGIKIPPHFIPLRKKQAFPEMPIKFSFRPCDICGEDRITHHCHILPRADGGPDDEKNYLYLCPTHHALFDSGKLDKKELKNIDISKKMQAAQKYFRQFILRRHKYWWQEILKKSN